MTKSEIKAAENLLADYTERTETAINAVNGKQVLTAYFNDGYQRLFYTLGEVIDYCSERERRANA